ncbi:hypothetical protein ERO13_D04G105800v2 [Gossypium hirsutum]|uniref:Uncharacterized protein n=1 Tax=Gossypium darwinii TaxID=34276 RepID=A0A5D2D0L1_GOSDA|nr:hypothetical protein ERO13_D04G105800v2 [Gossypium hirsutum]TYG73793.1 hypothetical protein ES288_D04G130500v1 [Gossypium darwinii]
MQLLHVITITLPHPRLPNPCFPLSAIPFFALVLNLLILRRLLAQTPSSSHSSPILHSPGCCSSNSSPISLVTC